MGNVLTQLVFANTKRLSKLPIDAVTDTGAPADTVVYPEGTAVKVSADNTYDIAGPTDAPVGIIVVPANRYLNGVNSYSNSDTTQRILTVQLNFHGKMTGVTSAAVTAGAEIKQTGTTTLASGEFVTTYAPATTGDFIVGIALAAQAVVGKDFEFAFFSPRKK